MRISAANGPKEETDSSLSAAGIDNVILEISEVVFVVVKSMSRTTSLPPNVYRRVCNSVLVSSAYTRNLSSALPSCCCAVPQLFYQCRNTFLSKP